MFDSRSAARTSIRVLASMRSADWGLLSHPCIRYGSFQLAWVHGRLLGLEPSSTGKRMLEMKKLVPGIASGVATASLLITGALVLPNLAGAALPTCAPGVAASPGYCMSSGGTGSTGTTGTVTAGQAQATSQAATNATVATISKLGIAGLVADGGKFSITFKSSAAGASFRYVLHFRDLRPGKKDKTVVVFQELTTIPAGKQVTIKVKLRKIGKQILAYAEAHHENVHVQVVNHLRPAGSTKSAQTLKSFTISGAGGLPKTSTVTTTGPTKSTSGSTKPK
jgi:hypothetical protein